MPPADLYLLRLQWLPYLTLDECRACGFQSCEEFLARLQNGEINLSTCTAFSPPKRFALQFALTGAATIPPVEALPLPQPTRAGLYEINRPGPEAPVLITGNSEITLTVLTAVLATTTSSFYLLLVDSRGDTVDMAMIYESLTAARIAAALEAERLADRVSQRRLVLPGLAASLQKPLQALCGWEVQVGPICALELPLFFGDYWQPSLPA